MINSSELDLTGITLSHQPSSSPNVKSARPGLQRTDSNQVLRLAVKKSQVCAVVFMSLFLSSCFAYPNPRIEAQKGRKPGAVYFRTECRQLSQDQLQKRMGSFYDSSRMADSEDTLRLGHGVDFSDSDLEGLQADDPDSDVMYDDAEEDDEEEEEEEKEGDSEYSEDKDNGSDESFRTQGSPSVFKYMRKRRWARSDSVGRRGLQSDIGTLQLKLALSGRKNKGHRSHDSRSRKQLKKELRDKIRKSNKDPPWQCEMRPEYKKMRDGIFPRYVTDGRCITDKCFFRIYNCVPKKYRIRLLERDPDRCNPIPVIGTNTTYEEKWYFRNYLVTVGCNCERRPQRKRRRH